MGESNQLFSIKDCGLMLEPQLGMSMDQLLQTASLAEDLGFGYLFRSDHLLPTDDRRGIDSPECWTSLGAIAATTKSLKFGPLVTPVGFRNPALLAKMACTLHSYSGGRLQLAMGAGWYESEYTTHGYEFLSFKVRRAQFTEALSVILPLVREEKVDFHGHYFSARTDCFPRPAGKVHVIIGARAKSMIRIAAQKADEWNFLSSTFDFFAEQKSVLENAANGREVEISEMGPFLLGRNRGELEANAKRQIRRLGHKVTPDELFARIKSRGAPCATPNEFADLLTKKLESGVQKFYFQTLVPENTEMIELLAETIKDRF